MCLNTFRAWGADEEIRPKENSWKKENPKGGEFLIEKCAAVRYRRVQHILELIYDQGVKEHIWEDSDNMFLKVSMKVDNVCKNASQ